MSAPNDDDDSEGSDQIGCLFPGKCLMPEEHYESECHTVEMMEEFEARQWEIERVIAKYRFDEIADAALAATEPEEPK